MLPILARGIATGLTQAAAKAPRNRAPLPTQPSASASNALFAGTNAFQLADQISSFAANNLPSFTHAITVRCIGGPDADIRRVWYLALAACFGRYRDGVRFAGGSATLQGLWDVTGKACQVELVYSPAAVVEAVAQQQDAAIGTILSPIPGAGLVVGALISTARSRIVTAKVDPRRDALSFIHRGPSQLTIGGSWPSFLTDPHTSIMRPAGGGGVAVVPSASSGFGGFLLGAAIAQTTGDWVQFLNCGRTGYPAVPYARLTTYNRFGKDVFREWPTTQGSQGITTYPFRVTASTTTTGGPGRHGFPGTQVSQAFPIPALPDDGRVITTGEKNDQRVQPPRPSVDGQSRLSLLGLTAQALAFPCFLPAAPPCQDNIIGGTGWRIYRPGEAWTPAQLDNGISSHRRVAEQPQAGSPNALPNLAP